MNDALEADDSEQTRGEASYPAHEQHRKNNQRGNANISAAEILHSTRRFAHDFMHFARNWFRISVNYNYHVLIEIFLKFSFISGYKIYTYLKPGRSFNFKALREVY